MDTSSSVDRSNEPCKNCGHLIDTGAAYCGHCGQKRTSGLITVKELFADFFESVFNLDSRFFKTIPLIFVPGKLTIQFFQGKHKQYFRPLRLFFTTMIVCFAVLGFKYLDDVVAGLEEGGSYERFLQEQQFQVEVDKAKEAFFQSPLTTEQKSAVDSFAQLLSADTTGQSGQFSLSLIDTSLVINFEDIATQSVDSVVEQMRLGNAIDKLMARQIIKSQKYPQRIVGFAIGNTTWMIILLMPAVAFVMKLLYARRNRYYVEHLVFLYHYHSMVFVVMTIFMFVVPFLPLPIQWLVPAALILFLFFAMKAYYRQGLFKTFVKYIVLLNAYLFILIGYISITAFISFLLFQ